MLPIRAALAAFSLGLLVAGPALAQPKPTVVVMGEDADEDSMPRGNRIFQRVIAELSETMNLRGYNATTRPRWRWASRYRTGCAGATPS